MGGGSGGRGEEGGGGWGDGGEDGGKEGGAEGDRGWDDNTCSTHVPKISMKHTNLGFLGGWADGRGVYIPRKRSERFEFAYRKLLGEIDAKFVRNLKVLVDFEVRT